MKVSLETIPEVLPARGHGSSGRLLRLAVDQAARPACVLDDAGRLLHANEAFCDLVGYRPHQLLNLEFETLLTGADDTPDARPTWQEARLLGHSRFITRFESHGGGADDVVPACGVDLHHDPASDGFACFLDLQAADAGSYPLGNNRQLRLFLEQVPSILWANDRDLQLTSLLGSGIAALEISPGDAFGDLFDLFETEEEDGPPISYVRRALEGESVTFEHEWLGQTMQIRVEPLRDPARGVVGAIGIAIDVTQQRRTEEALSLQEAYFQQLFENSPQAIVILDREDKLVNANRGFEQLFGYTVDEVRGRGLNEMIVPPTLKGEASGLSVSVHNRQIVQKETVRLNREGRLIHVSIIGYPIRFQDEVIGVYGIYNDISERKRAEVALRESEERYALAVQGANDGLWDWNLHTRRIYLSPRCFEILGLETGGAISTSQDWSGPTYPEQLDPMRREIEAHLRGMKPHIESELQLPHAGGGHRWVLCRGLVVREANGRAYRMAGSLTDITERKRAEERLVHEALHDSLTGLPNRNLFMDRLRHCLERARRSPGDLFAVLFLDLDRFKVINDSLGHSYGDRLLISFAERLSGVVRPMDTIARVGGDEFVILLEDISGVRDAIRVAERIQQELRSPFDLDGQEVFTATSIGIALSATGYQHPGELIRDADIAMYKAKTRGRACHAVFDTRMHSKAIVRLLLETDLRRAVDRREFHLQYQPVVSLRTGRVTGFEALLRWQHPKRGLVPPNEFLEIAEETGLTVPISHFVVQEACRQLQTWQRTHPQAGPLTMAVNLSTKQFLQADLIEQLDQALEETGLTAESLCLEITESVIMENAASVEEVLRQLRQRNIRLYLDDFGTGYSSLAYLHTLPIDTLKIDRSFVSRIQGEDGQPEIVQAIIHLARSLKLNVIGEGVETVDQLSALKEMGCEYGQGYYFARPLEPWEASTLLARRPAWL